MTKTDYKQAVKLIKSALAEDIGKGDITSELLIPVKSESNAEVLVKESGIISGIEIFNLVFAIIDKKIKTGFVKKDGASVKKGEVIGYVKGNTRNLLKGERVALNLLQKMSGIATQTANLTKKLNNKSIQIIDTRKTTPNMRIFEKMAVVSGGGANHRMGLYDMILIKDNHIEANKNISNLLDVLKMNKSRIRKKVELEVKDLAEFKIVLDKGKGLVNRIMLDNFKIDDVKKAAALNKGLFELEISGGVDKSNIQNYKNIKGVRYISVGAITHSVDSLDIALNFIT
ncbi:MAG TPA: carboxylating nicotinate-nucleotide diphosphorylase [Ignavibacteria bacterium]|nr:carboxylating nicotinate-nucleotide diphosphorylase [Ignavibacteria bacterium]HMR39941.1 carboxylating nicotinate-nucleotide diphosphorylase [Ignavibacteria bacterium]